MTLKKIWLAPDDGTDGAGKKDSTAEKPGKADKPELKFTKDQVNELMTKRVARSHKAFFDRYGVKDMAELDALFAKASDFDGVKAKLDELEPKYSDLETNHKDLAKKYAYKVGNINPDKIADIETYFKGKGIDIDENTLNEELKTHSDWVAKPVTPVIESMGAEVVPSGGVDEKEIASGIFGVPIN